MPPLSKRGRPPIDRRLITNALLYIAKTGVQWRLFIGYWGQPSSFINYLFQWSQ